MEHSSVAKVVVQVEIERGKPFKPVLWEYDKRLPIQDNIKQIIAKHNKDEVEPLPVNGLYGLKVSSDLAEHFVSAANVDADVRDGGHIWVVPSVQDTVRRLFDVKMNNEWLLTLSTDPVFLEEIVEKQRHFDLMRMIQDDVLNADGLSGALNVLSHLLQGYLRCLDDVLMERIVKIAWDSSTSTAFAHNLMIKVLRGKKEYFHSNQAVIMDLLKVPHVMKNLEVADDKGDPNFHMRVFMLINALISCSKSEKRRAILEELNSQRNHRIFHDFFKKKNGKIEPFLAREVFVLQARLLTALYHQDYIPNRGTITSTIYEDARRDSAGELEDLDPGSRNSAAPGGVWVSNLHKAESMCSILSVSSLNKAGATPLLQKCLDYGKQYYHNYFDSLEKSDYSCDAELYTISQNIISILTNLLCIGMSVHAYNYYLPAYFAAQEVNTPTGVRSISFFEELFVKTLMLLFRTKAEMRVKTPDDFKKLYQVLKKQLKHCFERHPMDFEQFDLFMTLINYTSLQVEMQKDIDRRWEKIYAKNACVQELKAHFGAKNAHVVGLSRFRVLQKGFVFRHVENKRKECFSLVLMPDRQSLIYADCSEAGVPKMDGLHLRIPAAGIKHVLYGEKSNLRSRGVVPASKTNLVFTIVYFFTEGDEKSIDCYFPDELDESEKKKAMKDNRDHKEHKEALAAAEKQKRCDMEELATIWKEGLHLINGRDLTSNDRMRAELAELNELDCKMQLIELQDVEIPMIAPEVPEFTLYGY